MTKIINKMGIITEHGYLNPVGIILHDTVSPSVQSGINGLLGRDPPLGYHFIIDTNGDVYQLAHITRQVWHAAGFNEHYLGIAMVGGGEFGPVTQDSIDSMIDLVTSVILPACRNITYITGHKHASRIGKVDPRFEGEPSGDVDWDIDAQFMNDIADKTGLQFVRPIK